MSSYDDYLSRISQSSNSIDFTNDSFYDMESCRHPNIVNLYRTPPSMNSNPILESNTIISINNSTESLSEIRYTYIQIQYHNYIIEFVTNIIFLSIEKLLIYKLFDYSNRILILTMVKALMFLVINLDIYYNNTDIVIFIYSCIRYNTNKYPIIIFTLIQSGISYLIDISLYNIGGDKYYKNLTNMFPSTQEDFIIISIVTSIYYLFISLILSKHNYTEIKIINLCGIYYAMNLIVFIPKYSILSSYLLLSYSYGLNIDNNLYIIFGILFSCLIVMIIIMKLNLRNEVI